MAETVVISTAPTGMDLLAQKEEQNIIQLFLSRLPSEDKLLISLFFGLDGERLKLKEIAAMLHSNETALQKRKDRCIAEFKEWLAKQKISVDELVCRQAARSMI
jgi:DNA-directed RNA polymerase specialized sigma24 family protein